MNFDNYTNSLPYPRKSDFITSVPFVLPSGKKDVEKIFDKEAYENAKLRYTQEDSHLIYQFNRDLKEYLGITNNPKADLLISKSWALGHSTGFSEIVNYAENLVGLIE